MHQMTEEGYVRLVQQCDDYSSRRKESLVKIKEARKFCDFRQDVTYMELVREHERIEEKLVRLERLRDEAAIIEHPTRQDLIALGNQVTLRELSDESEETYRLVGEAEADIENGTISVTSPLGAALVGKRVGERVTIHVTDNPIEFVVLAIDS